MTNTKKSELISRIEAEINDHFNPQTAAELTKFANVYFQDLLLEDMQHETIDNLYGTVICLWDFLQQRDRSTPKVRVYNPNFEEHSWQSTHTVIEVIADDMSFLVSSFNMALVRLGHTIHFTAHPIITAGRNSKGELTSLNSGDNDEQNEAVIRFKIDRISDLAQMEAIRESLLDTIVENMLKVLTLVAV